MHYFKKILLIGAAVVVIGFGLGYLLEQTDNTQTTPSVITPDTTSSVLPNAAQNNPGLAATKTPAAVNSNLPGNVLLNVPFLSQAPFGKWDTLHEDACEEASLVMLRHFSRGDKNISAATGDEELGALVNYENKNNYGASISGQQLGDIAKKYLNLSGARVKNNATIEDIKTELAAGRPVIVPAAGKILANQNFKNGGPLYHMLVVKGYDATGFITNDPGTRLGENFHYSFANFYEAMHDWNNGDVLSGDKSYLVFD